MGLILLKITDDELFRLSDNNNVSSITDFSIPSICLNGIGYPSLSMFIGRLNISLPSIV